MKRITFKSVLSIVLCSIVAMLAISCNGKIAKEEKFEPVEFSTKAESLYRWQEELEYLADTYKKHFPNLELVGWRNVGTLNSREAINKVIDDGFRDDAIIGHMVDFDAGVYTVAPLAEIAARYGVKEPSFSREGFDKLIQHYKNRNIPIGTELVELDWKYKGQPFVEKIIVIKNYKDTGILFSTISHRIAIKDAAPPKWYAKEVEERRQFVIDSLNTPEAKKKLAEHMKKHAKYTSAGVDRVPPTATK